MPRRTRNGPPSTKKPNQQPTGQGELLVSKNGVYLVQGDSKLKTIQLIPWDQIIPALPPARS